MYLEKIPILATLNICSIIIRIVLALILGGILGLEREQKQHPAGFRTYIIVCVGAALACITNVYMCQYLQSSDVARIPAQVISGMGFLGAGTILVTRNRHIKGLTTAAGLWCSATLGIAVGSGFYSGAIICGIVIVFSLRILSFVDQKFEKYNPFISLYAEYETNLFIRELVRYAKENGFEVKDLEIYPSTENSLGCMTCIIKITKHASRELVLAQLKELEHTAFLEEMSN